MSLINQMLKDLQEQEKGKPVLPSSLQPGPRERSSSVPGLLLLVCAGVVLLGLTWGVSRVLMTPTASVEPKPGLVEQRQPERKIPAKVAEADPVKVPSVATNAATASTNQPAPASVTKPAAASMAGTVVEPATRIAPQSSPAVTKPAEVVLARPPHKVDPVTVRAINSDRLPGAVQSRVRDTKGSSDLTPLGSSYKMADHAYLEGKQAAKNAQLEMAAKSLRQSLQLYAGHLPARELLAGIYVQTGKAEEAMALLDEGLAIAPDYSNFKKIYARILADKGDFNTAITILMRGGVPGIKSDPETHELLASLYQHLGESYLAAQTYRNLLTVWSTNGNYWFGLGDILEKQGSLDEAAGCYRTALESGNLRQKLREQAKNRLAALDQKPPA